MTYSIVYGSLPAMCSNEHSVGGSNWRGRGAMCAFSEVGLYLSVSMRQ